MAIARIKSICKECGKEFEVRKVCSNRTAADSYEAWAIDHVTVCNGCARKACDDKRRTAIFDQLDAANLVLPTISGASDKQIAYADDLRMKYLYQNMFRIKTYVKFLGLLADDASMAQLSAQCAERNMTIDAAIAEARKAYGLDTITLIFEESSARKIIDGCR